MALYTRLLQALHSERAFMATETPLQPMAVRGTTGKPDDEGARLTGWQRAQAVSTVMLAILAAIGALYLGREICIPIALAVLLNALLRPLVRGLERRHVSTVVGAT